MAITGEQRSFDSILDTLMLDLKQTTDDSFLIGKREYVADKIHDMNATLIREEYNNRGGRISDQYYKMSACLEVECQKNSCTVDNISFTSDAVMYTIDLPALIPNVGWKDISFLGTENFELSFTRKTIKGFNASKYKRWVKPGPIYTVIGSKAILKDLPTEGFVMATGVLLYKIPIQACNYKSTDSYPTPSVNKLLILVKKDLLSTWGITEDTYNDDTEIQGSPVQQSKQQTTTDEQ